MLNNLDGLDHNPASTSVYHFTLYCGQYKDKISGDTLLGYLKPSFIGPCKGIGEIVPNELNLSGLYYSVAKDKVYLELGYQVQQPTIATLKLRDVLCLSTRVLKLTGDFPNGYLSSETLPKERRYLFYAINDVELEI